MRRAGLPSGNSRNITRQIVGVSHENADRLPSGCCRLLGTLHLRRGVAGAFLSRRSSCDTVASQAANYRSARTMHPAILFLVCRCWNVEVQSGGMQRIGCVSRWQLFRTIIRPRAYSRVIDELHGWAAAFAIVKPDRAAGRLGQLSRDLNDEPRFDSHQEQSISVSSLACLTWLIIAVDQEGIVVFLILSRVRGRS